MPDYLKGFSKCDVKACNEPAQFEVFHGYVIEDRGGEIEEVLKFVCPEHKEAQYSEMKQVRGRRSTNSFWL